MGPNLRPGIARSFSSSVASYREVARKNKFGVTSHLFMGYSAYVLHQWIKFFIAGKEALSLVLSRSGKT